LPSSSKETFAALSDGAQNFTNTEVEEDVVVIEQGVIAINEEEAVGIKQEEIAEDISFPDIKTEPGEVSYVCVCLILNTFYLFPEIFDFFMSVFMSN
jgi:hypothetical protein